MIFFFFKKALSVESCDVEKHFVIPLKTKTTSACRKNGFYDIRDNNRAEYGNKTAILSHLPNRLPKLILKEI